MTVCFTQLFSAWFFVPSIFVWPMRKAEDILLIIKDSLLLECINSNTNYQLVTKTPAKHCYVTYVRTNVTYGRIGPSSSSPPGGSAYSLPGSALALGAGSGVDGVLLLEALEGPGAPVGKTLMPPNCLLSFGATAGFSSGSLENRGWQKQPISYDTNTSVTTQLLSN